MDSFELKTQERENCAIIEIIGYFALEAGKKLHKDVDDLLRKGKLNIILDFSKCNLVSSPGVAAVMEDSMKITEDFRGKIMLCCLDKLKTNVFTMAGILDVAPAFETVEAAVKAV